MKAHFDKPENCPAYNFYKAEEDIRYLLRDQKENLNEYEIYELNKVLIDLKEWFSAEYNERAYKQTLTDLRYKLKLEFKIVTINYIVETINSVNTEKISVFLNEKNVEKLKEICKKLNIAFIDLKRDMINNLERVKKGVTNDYNRVLGKFENENVKFNYVKTAINVLRKLNLNREPLKITLLEWVEMLKLVDEID